MNTAPPPPSLPVRLLRGILRLLGLETAGRALFHRMTRRRVGPMISETSKCRARLAPYCTGYGIDLGFGGDPITPAAIRMDMIKPYADYLGIHPVQLGGDVTDLHWFRDGVLDYVYSSHVLEDFVEIEPVLREWLRVLKPGGRLIIYCPDEQIYRKYCADTSHPYNTHHIHADFSLSFVQRALTRIGGTRELLASPHVEIYSWEIVVEKL
jgi:predicted SAM-dependent methyltransferase